jgi:protocatechuate 3,4-dioxygenase beta subunit
MQHDEKFTQSRRRLVGVIASTPLLAIGGNLHAAARGSIAPTPECRDDDEPTPRQTEGPYFRSESPQRQRLREPGMGGRLLTMSGIVLSTACVPIAGAKLDFWQCDHHGDYDNRGFVLRGHQFTDAEGRYLLETIEPALYPGRTRHIHVKVQAPHQRVLTTQLYFPGESRNQRDRIFDSRLLMDIAQEPSGLRGRFDFVMATG